MGSGTWSTNVYSEHNRHKAAIGQSTFDYSDRLRQTDRAAWRVHLTLNPYGVKFRESRDSDEHPESTAIAVLFDVTGSMLTVPVTLQQKLFELLGLLLRKRYVTDPQIMFGAIGDATCDKVPLQIGQFESDNRMDQNLENMFLEGGGGGQRTESYELGLYFMARHTDIDCWNKRGHKGYLFMIGDEMAYPVANRHQVQEHIGDGLERNLPIAAVLKELQQRYHVFYILPKAASYGGDQEILGFWRNLLAQNVLELDDPEAVCELIALTIGLTEGTIDLDEGAEHLKEYGVDDRTVQTVTTTLAHLPISQITATVSSGALLGLESHALLTDGVLRL
jgi:hypothetical protein